MGVVPCSDFSWNAFEGSQVAGSFLVWWGLMPCSRLSYVVAWEEKTKCCEWGVGFKEPIKLLAELMSGFRVREWVLFLFLGLD